ncbi:MAG: FmdE family protein [Thermaerobacter sp.]|nr:FmdE family protein [Thermaerobacter sp.]
MVKHGIATGMPLWLEEFHGHLCPFLVVGWRMGQEALAQLKVDRERDQGLFVFTELGGDALRPQSCYTDGLQAATGCTAGKGTLRSHDLGKVAAVLARPGEGALRIALRPDVCDELARGSYAAERRGGKLASAVPEAALSNAVGYVTRLSAQELFTFEHLPAFGFRPAPASPGRIRCQDCGEYVFEQQAAVKDGRILCRSCAVYSS